MRYKVPEFIRLFLLLSFFLQNQLNVSERSNIQQQRPLLKPVSDTDGDDFMCGTNPHGSPLAGQMWWSVRLKDRKVAYHDRNHQATDICHLQSFIIPSLFLPRYVLPHALSCALCFCCRTVPASKASLPLIFLITQTVHSSTPPSSPTWGNEKDEMAGNGEGEDGGDDLFVLEDSCVVKGVASAAESFPVTCIQLIL